MGQGSGGSAASLLALSGEGRSAKGVAALSGAPLSPSAVRPDPALHARSLANHTDCPSKPAERLLACLRKQPVENIVKVLYRHGVVMQFFYFHLLNCLNSYTTLCLVNLQADSKMHMDTVDTMKFLDEISGRSGQFN